MLKILLPPNSLLVIEGISVMKYVNFCYGSSFLLLFFVFNSYVLIYLTSLFLSQMPLESVLTTTLK